MDKRIERSNTAHQVNVVKRNRKQMSLQCIEFRQFILHSKLYRNYTSVHENKKNQRANGKGQKECLFASTFEFKKKNMSKTLDVFVCSSFLRFSKAQSTKKKKKKREIKEERCT